MAFQRKSKNGFDGDKYKFETAGQELLGYFLGTQEISIKGKPVKRHSFKTASGVVSTLGSTNLNEGLAECSPGLMTRVTFDGEVRTEKGNRFKKFTVDQDDEDILKELPASTPPKAAGSSVAAAAAALKGGSSQIGKTVA